MTSANRKKICGLALNVQHICVEWAGIKTWSKWWNSSIGIFCTPSLLNMRLKHDLRQLENHVFVLEIRPFFSECGPKTWPVTTDKIRLLALDMQPNKQTVCLLKIIVHLCLSHSLFVMNLTLKKFVFWRSRIYLYWLLVEIRLEPSDVFRLLQFVMQPIYA